MPGMDQSRMVKKPPRLKGVKNKAGRSRGKEREATEREERRGGRGEEGDEKRKGGGEREKREESVPLRVLGVAELGGSGEVEDAAAGLDGGHDHDPREDGLVELDPPGRDVRGRKSGAQERGCSSIVSV